MIVLWGMDIKKETKTKEQQKKKEKEKMQFYILLLASLLATALFVPLMSKT